MLGWTPLADLMVTDDIDYSIQKCRQSLAGTRIQFIGDDFLNTAPEIVDFCQISGILQANPKYLQK